MSRRIFLTLGAGWAFAICVACGSSAADEKDGGSITFDGQTKSRDARLRPDATQILTGECSTADLMSQLRCGQDKRCTVVSGGLYNGTGVLDCVEPGTRAMGTNCTSNLPGGPDDCEGGSICADPLSSGQEICLPFCDYPLGYCPIGVCGKPATLEGSEIFVCIPPTTCDPYDHTGCTAPDYCYWFMEDPSQTFCLSEGAGTLGSPCQMDPQCFMKTCFLNDCSSGLTCFGPPGEQKCSQVCLLSTGDPCVDQCFDVGHETYGVCAQIF